MNILITGASGFIASNIIGNAEPGWSVAGISRSGASGAQRNYKVDLSDTKSVNEFIRKIDFNIDLVIHTASALANKDNIRSMDLFYRNIAITENVIRIINDRKISSLINISSTAVYPNVDGTFTETSEIKPSVNNDCLYGLAKFSTENMFDFLLDNSVTQKLHLRVSQVYGDNMREDRTYKVMEKELKEYNRITLFGDGKRITNFIHVQLLIHYIKFCIDQNLKGIFNIGGENISYLQLAQIVAKNLKITEPEIILEQKGVKSKTFLDTSKFEAIYSRFTFNN